MTGQDVRRSTLREKGQLTLPSEIRQALHIEAGDEVEFQVVEGSQVLLRGLKMIPADQAWFWADSWQRGEVEATQAIQASRVETFKDEDSFLDFIQAPVDDA